MYVHVTELGSVNWFSGSLAKGIKNTDTHTHTATIVCGEFNDVAKIFLFLFCFLVAAHVYVRACVFVCVCVSFVFLCTQIDLIYENLA